MGIRRRCTTSTFTRGNELYLALDDERDKFNSVYYFQAIKGEMGDYGYLTIKELVHHLKYHNYDYVVCNRLGDLLCYTIDNKTVLDILASDVKGVIKNSLMYITVNNMLLVDSHNIFNKINYTDAQQMYFDFDVILNELCYKYPVSIGKMTDELFMRRYAPNHPNYNHKEIDETREALNLPPVKRLSFQRTNRDYGNIFIPDAKINDFNKNAFYGGRNEVYYQGRVDNATSFDMNGMYSHIMKNKYFPGDKVTSINSKSLLRSVVCKTGVQYKTLRDYIYKGYLAIAEVTVTIPDMNIPPFPVSVNKRQVGIFDGTADVITVYPTGTFRTFLSTPELQLAFENDWVESVYRYTVYEPVDYFSEFVDDLDTYKEVGSQIRNTSTNSIAVNKYKHANPKALKSIGKYGIIQFFGKLGQRSYDSDGARAFYSPEASNTLKLLQECKDYNTLVNLAQSQPFTFMEGTLDINSHPAISAHITAYARIMMWEKIQQIHECVSHDNVLYMDTDGIILKGTPDDYTQYFSLGEHLGQWKIETQGSGEIWSQKAYVIGDKTVHKNIGDSIVWDDERMYSGKYWESPIYKDHLHDGKAKYVLRSVSRSEKITNRIIQNNGSTAPYKLKTIPVYTDTPFLAFDENNVVDLDIEDEDNTHSWMFDDIPSPPYVSSMKISNAFGRKED